MSDLDTAVGFRNEGVLAYSVPENIANDHNRARTESGMSL